VDLTPIRVLAPDGATSAEFIPGAGMLCCSFTHDGDQLLDPGHGLDAYVEHGKTMGIPLLYPWANRIDGLEYRAAGRTVVLADDRAKVPVDQNDLPIHGAVPGLMRWDVDQGGDQTRISARLDWEASSLPELFELFPFEHEVRLDIAVGGGSLTIATTVRALGSSQVPVSFGYHPYLLIPGGGRAAWRVHFPPLDRLALDERNIPTGEREPVDLRDLELGDSSWDDGFEVLAQPARFEVSAPSGRGIGLELVEGFPFVQIYAPPIHDYICFEPMTAPANALRSGDGLALVEPGAAYRAVFRVTAWR